MMKKNLLRWLPAVLVMAIIFVLSNTPGNKLPNFGQEDYIVKKLGHMTGYAILALAYWYGLGFDGKRTWLAVLLAVLYAVTDEFHQIFIPGRHPSWVDVIIFDGIGASIGISLAAWWRVRKGLKNG
jgi:VanZ family protein